MVMSEVKFAGFYTFEFAMGEHLTFLICNIHAMQNFKFREIALYVFTICFFFVYSFFLFSHKLVGFFLDLF